MTTSSSVCWNCFRLVFFFNDTATTEIYTTTDTLSLHDALPIYTPIGFQGGLTGSLFLEFAITLAAAVVVSGIVAVTLSPVMSSRFVQEHGHETRLTALVNRGFDEVRRAYVRLLDGAIGMRWAVVGASVVVMLAAWPLYSYSRKELAPVEDQSHISLFMLASPDS